LIYHDGCRSRPDAASSRDVLIVLKALETMT
jgi:hypothetical protein